MIARALAGDGRWGSFRFTCGDEPGQWRPGELVSCTPPPSAERPFAWAAKVKPFVVESNEQFISKGPPALTSGQYTKEYNEVKALGVAGLGARASSSRCSTSSRPTRSRCSSRSFRTYALAQGLGLAEQARLFGLFGLAGGDTNITCWEGKAHWSYWRPQTAIRLGDDDGNPKTEEVGLDVRYRDSAVSRPCVGLQLQDRVVHDHRASSTSDKAARRSPSPPERNDAGIPALP